MSTLGWILSGFALCCGGCLAMVWVLLRFAAKHDEHVPYDDMVDVVSEPSELEWQEFELRAHSDYDVYRFAQRMPGEERP